MPRHPFLLRGHTHDGIVQNRVYLGHKEEVKRAIEAKKGREKERVEK